MSWKWLVFTLAILFFFFGITFARWKRIAHCQKDKDIRALVRQTARWAVASQQDRSPMIALLHANYAAGYLQALELIATENEINRTTNLQVLRTKVYTIQDKAARMVIATCPQYMGVDTDKELVKMGIRT